MWSQKLLSWILETNTPDTWEETGIWFSQETPQIHSLEISILGYPCWCLFPLHHCSMMCSAVIQKMCSCLSLISIWVSTAHFCPPISSIFWEQGDIVWRRASFAGKLQFQESKTSLRGGVWKYSSKTTIKICSKKWSLQLSVVFFSNHKWRF